MIKELMMLIVLLVEIGKRVESIQVQRTTPIPNNDLFWIILCGFLLTCACFLV